MENLLVRGATRQRMNRERSWHKTALRPRRRHCTKGKSCSLLASPYHFSLIVSSPMAATVARTTFPSLRHEIRILCAVAFEANAVSALIHIDDREFTWHEFGKMLCVYAG